MSAKKLTEVAVILSAVDKMSKVIAAAVGKSDKTLASWSKRTKAYGESAMSWGKNTMITGAVILAPLLMSIGAAEEAQVAFNRLDKVYKQMGETTGEVAKEQAAWASAYQFEIGVEDEAIMLAQAKLATFSNVMSKEARDAGVMNRATQLAFDLQAAGFGDASGNAVQLGKALQDPIKGIKALAKSGVTFTDAEKKKIEALVKSGHLLEAQNIVLQAIEGQVGGVAKSTVTDSAKMKLALGELQEQVGGALLPVITKLATKITKDIFPAFMKWKADNEGLFNGLVKTVGAVGVIVTALGAFGVVAGAVMKGISAVTSVMRVFGYVTKIATAAQWLMNAAAAANPYVLIVIAIMAVIAAIVLVMVYFDQLYNWYMKQSTGIKILVAALVLLFAPFLIMPIMIRLVIKHWDVLKAKFNQFLSWFKGWGKYILLPLAPLIAIPLLIVAYWKQIKGFFSALWSGVVAIFKFHIAVILAIPGLIRDRWNFMIAFYTNLWNNIKNIFLGFVSFVLGIPTRMYEAGRNMINSLYEGMKSVVNKPIQVITNVTDQIRDFLPFSPAKRGALRDIHRVKLMETVAASIKPGSVLTAMDKVTQRIANASAGGGTILQPALAKLTPPNPVNPVGSGAGGGNNTFTITISPNVTVTGSGENGAVTKEDIRDGVLAAKADVEKWIRDILNNNSRKGFNQ